MIDMEFTNEELQRTRSTGPLIGIENLLRSEFNNWFRTKKWWINILLWTVIINGMVMLVLTALPKEEATINVALQIFTLFSWMGTSVGIIIMMQDSIVGEKLTGTAEWVLSKPVSRSSFILAKFTANAASALVTMNLIPSISVYFLLRGWGFDLTLTNFLAGSILLFINLVYFLTLTLMMGTFFSTRSAVIGIPIGFLFGQQFISSISVEIFKYIPYAIGNPVQGPALTEAAILGLGFWSVIPIWSSIISIIVFLVIAVRRFQVEQF